MIILGIETSCDETAVSVVEGKGERVKALSHVVASQVKTHLKYGGVVPEVAAREHMIAMIPTLNAALLQSRIKPEKLDAIAVTSGPGLITALRVGTQAAKTLSYAWKKPLLGVNHIEGHILANWFIKKTIKLPALCLVVSGGHTELILMKKHGDYHLIGNTLDDAAGEAFDKVAKLLNIQYPGGPKIQKLAEQGNPAAFDFPRPMLNSANYNFSFSGLKTSVLYFVKKHPEVIRNAKADLCASFQQAIVDVLVGKTIRAAKELKVKTVLLAGGVAANQPLRQTLEKKVRELKRVNFFTPPLSLCTDNASMIAAAGYFRARKKDFDDFHTLEPDPNWELVR
ncbi:MAG: tRNA (adenosine(37)-N6)-threonylcarbamoyltransferase complex transferase subunit TsaD [Patescibacteria group bacterium]